MASIWRRAGLKGLHSCASASAFRGTDTRPLPGKEVELVVMGGVEVVGWTKRKLELESLRACSAEASFSLDHVPVGKSVFVGWGVQYVFNTLRR